MRYILTFLLASLALPHALRASAAEPPRVVTDLAPVHSLVAQVMAGVAAPEMLLEQGADAHSFQLRPSQAAALAEADLVVWIGPEMTPWLDRALTGLGPDAVQLDLIHAEGTRTRAFGAGQAHDDHGHEEEHDDHGGHGDDGHAAGAHDHEGHDHDGTDPHAWLDPTNAHLWLGLIATELARLDPANAATYGANAARAQAELAAVDAEIAALLAPVKGKSFVTFHDAYGYFTGHYGLEAALPVSLGDASAPGAAHLAALRARIADVRPSCLFPEAQHDPALMVRLAEDSGARIGAALDPEGSMLEPGPEAYAALLRGLAQALSTCLSEG